MSTKLIITSIGATVLIAVSTLLPACQITYDEDGIKVLPARGKPRVVPPSRISRHIIDGVCYYFFEGRDGDWFCFPCDDLEDGETGYADPCNPPPRSRFPDMAIMPSTFITPVEFPSPEERAFMSMLAEWMRQENIPLAHDSIWFHFGLDQWVEGETATVPMALAELNDDGENGFLKFMMITRTDWDYPDNSTGSDLEYFFLRDASDDEPDAMVLQLSGTFQQVADSMKTFFDGVFTLETEYDGYGILIIGDQNLVSFIIDGVTVWEG